MYYEISFDTELPGTEVTIKRYQTQSEDGKIKASQIETDLSSMVILLDKNAYPVVMEGTNIGLTLNPMVVVGVADQEEQKEQSEESQEKPPGDKDAWATLNMQIKQHNQGQGRIPEEEGEVGFV